MKYVILAAYVVMMVIVALITSRKSKTLHDFFLGGRSMGPWMSAFAYGTTYFSAVIFIGYAGQFGWKFGLSATWIGIGNALLGSFLAWRILASRTRAMTHHLNASTMPEFFSKRYNSRGMMTVAALLIFVFMVPYTASVYQGLSYLFGIIFQIPFFYCMLGMAVLTGIYLIIGGYVATALADFIQGIIMLVGIVLVIGFVLSRPEVGGLTQGLQSLRNNPIPGLASLLPTKANALPLISLILLTSLGSWGLPQMVHKFYTVRDQKSIRRGTVISTVFALVVAGGAYFLGVFGRLFLNNTVPLNEAGKQAFDMVMPQMMQAALPDVLLGVVIVLVLSASMSTLSSLVLVSSSAIGMDLTSVALPKMTSGQKHVFMRILCGIFVLISFWLATNQFATIVQLMSISWGVLSGSFLGPFLYGLYWKRTTKAGAWAGIISGVVVGIFCNFGLGLFFSPETVTHLKTILTAPFIGSAAMVLSLIIVPVVSLMTPKMDPKFVDGVMAFKAE